MDPDRVHEANFARGEGLFEEESAGLSEERTDVGAERKGVELVVDRGDGLRSNAEHVARVLGVRQDAEGGLADGDHGAERLDEASALDFEEVRRYLLLRHRFRGEANRLGVVEGPPRLARLLEHRVQTRVLRVLRDGFAHGVDVLVAQLGSRIVNLLLRRNRRVLCSAC